MTDTLPAQSALAEQAVLGAMLLDCRALKLMSEQLSSADFYRPQNATIFAALCLMLDESTPVDPLTTAASLGKAGVLARVGGAIYLHTLTESVPSTAHCGYYASIIKDAARCRRVLQAGERLVQLARDYEAANSADADEMMEQVAGETLNLSLLLDHRDDGRPIEGLSTWDQFLQEQPIEEQWRIPGLLAKQDVFMLLSVPGMGKSVLSRQICLCLAGGMHPFTTERIPPMRTLLIDLENPPTTVAIQSRPIHQQVQSMGEWAEGRGYIWRKPGGLNLRKREDAQLLERAINETQPDLVGLGSLYKAYSRGKDDWDTCADETRMVFDKMRERYGVTLWLEHHMPRGQHNQPSGNPFGSTIWERWPGFGRMLTRLDEATFELSATFRGDRDVRRIPAGLRRGGVLPWTPIWDDIEMDYLRPKKANA